MAYHGHDRSIDDLARQSVAAAKLLTVVELKNVLRQEGLQVSGIKSELQIRVIAQIEKAQHDQNRAALERIKTRITPGRSAGYGTSYPSPYSNHTPTSSLSPQQFAPTPSRLPSQISTANNAYNMALKRNPFVQREYCIKMVDRAETARTSELCGFALLQYQIRSYKRHRVQKYDRCPRSKNTQADTCLARETTRDTARIPLSLSQNVINELKDPNSNTRVMVFCAADGKPSEIAFPHQVELKCNDTDVKANLRGLKNKPGSTRPADITNLLSKKVPGLNNTIEMTYALTNKDKLPKQKFYVVINLVHKKPVETLVQELQRGKFISKDQVLREMQRQAADSDIVAVSSVMSLKCPLSYMRIKTPCRGIGCKHNQCFDASSYLQLQEQAPTWTCPVCNKTAAWEHLVLDLYMMDILKSTDTTIEEVTIEPDGRWHLGKDTEATGANGNRDSNPTPSNDGDSDDVLEIIENPIMGSIKRELQPMAALTPSSLRTPPVHSRDESRAPSASASRSNKRPQSEVIDLTLSDDDDDDQPPVKRQRPSMSSTTNSFRARPPDRAGSGTPSMGNGFSFSMQPPPTFNPAAFDFDDRYGAPGWS